LTSPIRPHLKTVRCWKFSRLPGATFLRRRPLPASSTPLRYPSSEPTGRPTMAISAPSRPREADRGLRHPLHHYPRDPIPGIPSAAEPAVGEVHLHFTADQSLRADCKDITYDQHPDHQFRINRRATHGRIMGCKFAGGARTDREQCRSSAPGDLRGPRRQDETRRTVDLGLSSDGPSWIDLAAIRVNTTESRLV